MRVRSWLSAVVALVIVVAVAVVALHATTKRASSLPPLPVVAGVGGDFELARAGGGRVHLHDYRGRVVLLFFGYTSCPDVCPMSLSTLKLAVDQLGKAADHVQVIMVTVDPERDSPAHLERYVRYFDPRFLGLSGTTEDIRRVAGQYRVYYQKEPRQGEGYLVSHSAYVYLLDKQGRVRALFGAGVKPGDIIEGVRRVLQETASAA